MIKYLQTKQSLEIFISFNNGVLCFINYKLITIMTFQPGNFSCNCEAGWTGQRCDVDIDECASQPCQNNATCTDKVRIIHIFFKPMKT